MAVTKKPIRKFTDEGLKAFEAYIDQGPLVKSPPPVELLEDDRYSQPLGLGEVMVKTHRMKFDLGAGILADIGKENAAKLLTEPNAWPWLSLLFHQSTMPKKLDTWFIGTKNRHIRGKIAGRKQEQSHRHLVYAAVFNVYRFAAAARVLMEGASQQAKIEENIMSRRRELPVASSTEVVKALYKLYWDPAKGGRVRKGAKSTGAGSIIRFIDLMRQLDATYDLLSMSAENVVHLLPKAEFGKFLERA